MKRLMLTAALGSMLLGTACAQADTPKTPIDISVALECRIVRSWTGHPFSYPAERAVADYEEENVLIEAQMAAATTVDEVKAINTRFDEWEKKTMLHDYHKKILVAYNHGVSDAATIADPFYMTQIVAATDNSITIASVPDKPEYFSQIDGTINRRSGHGEIVERKTSFIYTENGEGHTKTELDKSDVVECVAAQPAKF